MRTQNGLILLLATLIGLCGIDPSAGEAAGIRVGVLPLTNGTGSDIAGFRELSTSVLPELAKELPGVVVVVPADPTEPPASMNNSVLDPKTVTERGRDLDVQLLLTGAVLFYSTDALAVEFALVDPDLNRTLLRKLFRGSRSPQAPGGEPPPAKESLKAIGRSFKNMFTHPLSGPARSMLAEAWEQARPELEDRIGAVVAVVEEGSGPANLELPSERAECSNVVPQQRRKALDWLDTGYVRLERAKRQDDGIQAGHAFLALWQLDQVGLECGICGGTPCQEALPLAMEAFRLFTSKADPNSQVSIEILERADMTFSVLLGTERYGGGTQAQRDELRRLYLAFASQMRNPPNQIAQRVKRSQDQLEVDYFTAKDLLRAAQAADQNAHVVVLTRHRDGARKAARLFSALGDFRDARALAEEATSLAAALDERVPAAQAEEVRAEVRRAADAVGICIAIYVEGRSVRTLEKATFSGSPAMVVSSLLSDYVVYAFDSRSMSHSPMDNCRLAIQREPGRFYASGQRMPTEESYKITGSVELVTVLGTREMVPTAERVTGAR